MRRLLLLLTALAVVVLTGPARAGYHLVGVGASSCGTWLADRADTRNMPSLNTQSWVLGFLSGVGFMGNGFDPLQGLDANAVTAWLDNYCRTHSLENLGKAAGALIMQHSN
jgi:hypothetical protein